MLSLPQTDKHPYSLNQSIKASLYNLEKGTTLLRQLSTQASTASKKLGCITKDYCVKADNNGTKGNVIQA